ncbi:MAG: hypothetical protein ACOYL3_07150 [Desulfuromonadaceae bacterium]
MAEHYTRNTTGVLKFCNRCNRMTMHKVSGKKLGLCTEDHHIKKSTLALIAKNNSIYIEPGLF